MFVSYRFELTIREHAPWVRNRFMMDYNLLNCVDFTKGWMCQKQPFRHWVQSCVVHAVALRL